jgi:hypothetical protein
VSLDLATGQIEAATAIRVRRRYGQRAITMTTRRPATQS